MCSGDLEQVILATAGYDHTIKFWNILTGICTSSLQHPDSQVNALEITPDKKQIAAASYQHIRMYDIVTMNPNSTINYEGISKNVTSIGFQEDGRWMYTGGEDNTARIWDLRTHNLQCQRLYNVHSPINTVTLHPNQTDLYIGDQSGAIHQWDLRLQNGEAKKEPFYKVPEMDISIQYIHIDPEGRYIAAVDNVGHCYLFTIQTVGDTAQCSRQVKIRAQKRAALKCKFSPDSTLLVTASADGTAKIWRTADLQLRLSEPADVEKPAVELVAPAQRWVWDVAFSADSQYILTGSSDNSARLWSAVSGELKREYVGHQKAIIAIALSDTHV